MRALSLGIGLAFALAGSALAQSVDASATAEALGLGRVTQSASQGKWLYLALESGGVAVIETGSPARLVTRIAEGRQIGELFIREGVLTLIEVRQELLTYSLEHPESPVRASAMRWSLPEHPTATGPATPTADPPKLATVRGQVKEVVKGRAIFEGGTVEGFIPGKRVRVLSQRLVEKPDLTTGENRKVPSGEVSAVLQIEQAEQHRAMAMLGRGDVVAAGDIVELTEDPVSERLWVPRRAPFHWRFGFVARPFLGLDTGNITGTTSKPVGVLIDAFGAYYFEDVPIAIELAVAPLGLAVGTVDTHYPTTMSATAAYATDYFEIGLGVGGLLGAAGPCMMRTPDSATECESNSGFTINQVLRLGAIDGIHLRWQSSIFSRPSSFVFGVGRGEINVPLTSRLGLFGGGGGGENGWAYGEFGVRSYLGGAGAQGTTILSASLGYAALMDGPSHEMVGGPSVAFGIEWRQ